MDAEQTLSEQTANSAWLSFDTFPAKLQTFKHSTGPKQFSKQAGTSNTALIEKPELALD